jgi:hypothetical protein
MRLREKRILIMSRDWKSHGFPSNRALKTDMRPNTASKFKNRNKNHFRPISEQACALDCALLTQKLGFGFGNKQAPVVVLSLCVLERERHASAT